MTRVPAWGATHLLLYDRRPRALCVGFTSVDGPSDAPQDAAVLSVCRSPLLGLTYAVILTRLLVKKSKKNQ